MFSPPLPLSPRDFVIPSGGSGGMRAVVETAFVFVFLSLSIPFLLYHPTSRALKLPSPNRESRENRTNKA